MSTWVLPAETGAYGAVGTVQTCTAAGFFGQTMIASALYNGSLALFYLLTVKYSWKDDAYGAYGGGKFSRVEPFMHAVPLLFGWGTAIAGLPLLLYNPIGWTCWIAEVPRGCDRDPNVECERGDNSYIYRWAFFHAELWATFVLVIVMMIAMYKSVRDREKKSRRYSVNQQQQSSSSQARRVAKQALLYVLAYCITWIFPMTTWLTQLVQGKTYTPILMLQAFFVPLQGFFNAFIYMRPRYQRYRRANPELSGMRVVILTFGSDPIMEKASGSRSGGMRGSGGSAAQQQHIRRDTDFHSFADSRRWFQRLSLTGSKSKRGNDGEEGGTTPPAAQEVTENIEAMTNEENGKVGGVESAEGEPTQEVGDQENGGEIGDDDNSLINEENFE